MNSVTLMFANLSELDGKSFIGDELGVNEDVEAMLYVLYSPKELCRGLIKFRDIIGV